MLGTRTGLSIVSLEMKVVNTVLLDDQVQSLTLMKGTMTNLGGEALVVGVKGDRVLVYDFERLVR